VNPSGRLPITFPAYLAQTPRPELPGLGTPWGTPTTIEYNEGAEVGYRWFAKQHEPPLYAFGHGLSDTTFAYRDLQVDGGETITATSTVTNTGGREGADVPQLYLTNAASDGRMRLVGFERVELAPRETRRVTITADPRLLARFDGHAGHWVIRDHHIAVGTSAERSEIGADVALARLDDCPIRQRAPAALNAVTTCTRGVAGRRRLKGSEHDLSALDDAATRGCASRRIARRRLRAGPLSRTAPNHHRHARVLDRRRLERRGRPVRRRGTLTTSSILDPGLTITDPWLKLCTAGYVLVGIGILVELARRLGMGFMIARAELEEAKAAEKATAAPPNRRAEAS
jgi:hypothetical protein